MAAKRHGSCLAHSRPLVCHKRPVIEMMISLGLHSVYVDGRVLYADRHVPPPRLNCIGFSPCQRESCAATDLYANLTIICSVL